MKIPVTLLSLKKTSKKNPVVDKTTWRLLCIYREKREKCYQFKISLKDAWTFSFMATVLYLRKANYLNRKEIT